MSTSFLTQYGAQIATLSMEHLWLTGAAMLLATAIAVPAALLALIADAALGLLERRFKVPA